MRLSILVPARNEADTIAACLQSLQALRADGHEVILIDGGSSDATRQRAEGLVDRILACAPGRARQMNAGAAIAAGDVLWFVHADTQVPEQAYAAIRSALTNTDARWGRFDLRLSGSHPAFGLIAFFINLRSRLSGIATGDQGIFVHRTLFEGIGGFADLPLMEDVDISKRLKRVGPPACLRTRLTTSSRRWETQGIFSTIRLMWMLRLRYFLGADPHALARRYYAEPEQHG